MPQESLGPVVWNKKRILAKLKPTPEKSGYYPLVHPALGEDATTPSMVADFESIYPGKPAHEPSIHLYEEVIIILEGKGYSVLGGKRYDWEKGDVISLPSNIQHQHFNLDPKKEALLVAVKSRPLASFLRLPTLPGAFIPKKKDEE